MPPDADVLAPDARICHQEAIHAPGSIQPHGMLVVCDAASLVIEFVSANVEDRLGVSAADLLGSELRALLAQPDLLAVLRMLRSDVRPGIGARLYGCTLRCDRSGRRHDVTLNLSGRYALVELEPSPDTPGTDPSEIVTALINGFAHIDRLQPFCAVVAESVQALIGFARVMVYCFAEDHSGQVIAETCRDGLEPLQGLRFPATDIPIQARSLFVAAPLRFIPDARYTPCPLLPQPAIGVDLTRSELRSVSPVHRQYLTNLGVAASLSISIVVRGRLWGMIACHHPAPRHLPIATRAALEVAGRIVSMQIEARQGVETYEERARARAAHRRIAATLRPDRPLFESLAASGQELLNMLSADGFGTWLDGTFSAFGRTPPPEQIPALVRWLDTVVAGPVFATDRLAASSGLAPADEDSLCGLLAISLSARRGQYVMLFRGEAIQVLAWAGDPRKMEAAGALGVMPRASFATWRNTVRGRSTLWKSIELEMAAVLRASILERALLHLNFAEQGHRATRERENELQRLFVDRMADTLAAIAALAGSNRSARASLERVVAGLRGRIRSLYLADGGAPPGPGHDDVVLDRLLDEQLAAYRSDPHRSIVLHGPAVKLRHYAGQVLSLVIHEMADNAARFGALSDAAGRLTIAWTHDADGNLSLQWTEEGGPPPRPPFRSGFGTTVTRRAIPNELLGAAQFEFRPAGLAAKFTIPRRFLATRDGPAEGPS